MSIGRNHTGGRFSIDIAGHNVGFMSQMSWLGQQQAIKGEIISSPKDREVVAEILKGLAQCPVAQCPAAQAAMRHKSR